MLKRLTNRRLWVRGVVGAFIAGGAHSVSNLVVAPETFNFHAGLVKLLESAMAGGMISAAFYLQKSPLPDLESDDLQGDSTNNNNQQSEH